MHIVTPTYIVPHPESNFIPSSPCVARVTRPSVVVGVCPAAVLITSIPRIARCSVDN